jgi:hypothetical protein
MVFPAQFRSRCVACDATSAKMTKEHFWPQWLIARTRTHLTSVRLDSNRRVNPKRFKVPLCERCNHDIGGAIEGPVSAIFDDLETGRGISDSEAELLVRWLWKFDGIAWRFRYPDGVYSERYTLRDKVLSPIDQIRDQLALAISVIAHIHPDFGDAPMGLDSTCSYSAIHVAGVFSRVALMVLRQEFEPDVPPNFSIYHFAGRHAPDRNAKLFYPKTGFGNCVEAVEITTHAANVLSYAHDLESRARMHAFGA